MPAAKTLQVPPVSTDNRTRTAPTSSLTLPPDFGPGFYNLAFTTDSGNGNSWGGASVIDVGASGAAADSMAALNQRPLQQPVLAISASCPVSPTVNLMGVGPDYGFGDWPAFLSGQTSWYADGQAAMLMVGSSYSGPLLVRGFQLDSNGRSNVTLAEEDLPPASAGDFAAKEKQHSVELVSGIHTTKGGAGAAVVPSVLTLESLVRAVEHRWARMLCPSSGRRHVHSDHRHFRRRGSAAAGLSAAEVGYWSGTEPTRLKSLIHVDCSACRLSVRPRIDLEMGGSDLWLL